MTIFHHALEAVDPAKLVRKYLLSQSEPLIPADSTDSADLIPPSPPLLRGGIRLHEEHFPPLKRGESKGGSRQGKVGKIIVIGTGKGTAPMAQAVEEILGDRITAGAITVKYGHGLPLKKIKVYEAGHPIPDQATLEGTRVILDLVHGLNENDLVLALISGGGSALLELPAPPITLKDLQATNAALLACGASITEMNAVRRHISLVKGGRLAQAAQPARVITLAISDVIGNPPESISSGPTAPDPSTFADAWKVVEQYSLEDKLPVAVVQHLKEGLKGKIPDTPKPADSCFDRADYSIIGSNRILLEAAKQEAEKLGYQTEVLTDRMSGEARDKGQELATLLKYRQLSGKPGCLLVGGETTVTLRGSGKGGRNQQLALVAAIEMEETEGCLLLSAGSDGSDGPTDAAGAIADGTTIQRAVTLGMNAGDYLDRHDSYPFFQALGDLVITGPTRTNVMDIVIMLKIPPNPP